MDQAELIAKMRGRVDMCRRLAASTTDPKTANVLRQMADEGARDIGRIEAEGEGEAVATIVLKPDAELPKP